MKKLILSTLILICAFGANAQRKKLNPYHTQGTKEYQEVTSKLLGVWNMTSFTLNKVEQIGNVFDSATVEFNDSGETRTATFRFTLPKATIDKRIASWNKKEATITVDSYIIISVVEFEISNKGVLVTFDKQVNFPEITGSGDQLENFEAVETLYITSQSSMKNEGGVGNLIGARIMKSVTSTEFIPVLPMQVNYKDLTDKSVNFISLSKKNFTLTKQ